MAIPPEISKVIEQIAETARGAQRGIRYFLFAGLSASAYIAWQVYAVDSPIWWNILKCGLVLAPAMIWVFLWLVLLQLQEAPELVSELAHQPEGLFNNLHELSLTQTKGLRGIFNSLKAFRQEEGLSVILETIAGISLLANPLFAIVALICAMILIGLMIIVPILIIF